MKVDLRIHPAMRFSCTQCGHCCRGWAISFSDWEKSRFDGEDWGAHFPDLAGRTLWEPVAGATGALKWRMRLREDGACPFLGGRNQCRLHEKFGAEAKPLACRIFPYTFAETPAGTFVGQRFNCPGVLEGRGERTSGQVGELAATLRDLGRVAALPAYPERVPVGGRGRLDWSDLQGLEAGLQRLMDDSDLSLPRRLLVMVRLAGVLEGARMESLTGDRLRQMLEMVMPELKAGVAEVGLASPGLGIAERALFHQFLAIVHSQEYAAYGARSPRRGLRLRLCAAANGYRFLFGRGTVEVSGWPGPVDLARVWDVPAPPSEARVSELLERYVRAKLWGKASFSRLLFDLRYEQGLGFLGALVAAASWWARASTVARGAAAAEVRDWEQGMSRVDGAITSLRGASFYHRMVLRSVARPDLAERLVHWLAAPRGALATA